MAASLNKPALIEKRRDACVAEAVAHYYSLGYTTCWDRCDDDLRVMVRPPNRTVEIRQLGLLNVVSRVYEHDHNEGEQE